jgi:hypothetical protein
MNKNKGANAVVFGMIIGISACGGGTDPGEPDAGVTGSATTIDGTIQGHTVSAATTAAVLVAPGDVIISVSSLENACASWKEGTWNQPGATAFALVVTSGTTALAPGSYPIEQGAQPAPYANVTWSVSDSMCKQIDYTEAKSGSVILQTVTPSLVTGSFDVTLYTGDHVSGTFSAPVCDAPASADAAPPCGS